MHPSAMERLAQQRAAELRDEAARSAAAASRGTSIKDLTGWALIQVGLALVTSSARRQPGTAIIPELR
jgi:hypothetical protein